ncbi:rRNA methyltransferase 3, mitochondrial [Eublepharis macularius]|uniref:rRNA methyltransferase 3, mitochondrial n=1 Tax=Eublepharis macularius TaxID=481883 RepID=A0AA97KL79_EUBMA|nr:rRNA methyltransferase 3, mitochondrial [Eublepharis macularius]
MASLVRSMARFPFLLPRPPSRATGGERGVRALRRSPVRVLPPRAQAQEDAAAAAAAQAQQQAGPRQKKPRSREPKAPAEEPQKEAELRYERAGPGDKRLSKVVTIAKSRAFREKHGKILLEGRRLIADALAAGAVPQTLFFSILERLRELPAAQLKGASLVKVKFEDVTTWSDVIAPQGVIGIFPRPDHAKMTYPEVPQQHRLPLSLICDNVRDPGNLGTILRSAAGAGCERVLLVKGCVDAWEPKVLRAGMGAHFRLPVISNLEWEVVPNYLPPDTCVYTADCTVEPSLRAQEEPPVLTKASWSYELKVQPVRGAQGSDPDSEEAAAAAGPGPLGVKYYFEPWMEGPVAVVIGGETHGLSVEAKKLTESTGGRRLLIPVVPGVESLNAAMAASILLFEAKRQLHQREEIGSHEEPRNQGRPQLLSTRRLPERAT